MWNQKFIFSLVHCVFLLLLERRNKMPKLQVKEAIEKEFFLLPSTKAKNRKRFSIPFMQQLVRFLFLFLFFNDENEN